MDDDDYGEQHVISTRHLPRRSLLEKMSDFVLGRRARASGVRRRTSVQTSAVSSDKKMNAMRARLSPLGLAVACLAPPPARR